MPRPKGSKNKPKNIKTDTIEIVKRPRGRPRKTPLPTATTEIVKRPRGRPRKTPFNTVAQPNTNMEEFEDENEKLNKIDLPEIDDDAESVIDTYRSTRWTSDEWGGGLDNFSIGSDSFY